MTAIYGRGFCAASRDSFCLLARNLVRVMVLNRVTAFLLFVGKTLITLSAGIAAHFYFSGRWIIDDIPQIQLHFYWVPVVAVVIGTYFICDLFFEVHFQSKNFSANLILFFVFRFMQWAPTRYFCVSVSCNQTSKSSKNKSALFSRRQREQRWNG